MSERDLIAKWLTDRAWGATLPFAGPNLEDRRNDPPVDIKSIPPVYQRADWVTKYPGNYAGDVDFPPNPEGLTSPVGRMLGAPQIGDAKARPPSFEVHVPHNQEFQIPGQTLRTLYGMDPQQVPIRRVLSK